MKTKLLLLVSASIISFHLHSQTPDSKHFTIQKLADGIYAAVSKSGGYSICNAGIIDLGDATLIFDPFMTPEAAEDLKKASFALTGHDVKYVVNSHFHNDHIGGNQVFGKAGIISTGRTKELIAKFQPEEIADDKISAPGTLEKLKSINTSQMNPHELEEHAMKVGYYEGLVKSGDSLRTVLPDITFDEKLIISGSKRSVQLFCYGTGHTESDLFMMLPAERLAFLGDLLFIQNHPWLGDGDVDKWRTYLDSISKLDLQVIVPGHGPVGTAADIETMKAYFNNVIQTAITLHSKGILPETENNLKASPPFDTWYLSNFYKPNVIMQYHLMYK